MSSENYILLVDDDATCHFLNRRLLASLPFNIVIADASDGIAACDHIRQHGFPVFILLDLRMPRMDGREFLEVLANGDLGDDIPPVCIATSSARPEDQQLSTDYYFVKSCFEKPIRKSQVPEIASIIGLPAV